MVKAKLSIKQKNPIHRESASKKIKKVDEKLES